MRNRLIGFIVVVLAVAAVGCGGSSGNTYTCNFAASYGACYEWDAPQALPSAQVTQLQTACTSGAAAGTFSTGSTCPSASRVGTCALTNSQVSGVTYKYVFYGPTYTAASGQQACASLTGTWTAG
jgi:hypothetical protein